MNIPGYQIQEILGQGSMGTVYRALAPDGRQVALKVLGPESPRDRFRAEAETLARLQHPGIPQVFDFSMDGVPYLSQEILEGATLAQVLQSGALPLPRALEIADSLLSVLQVIHDCGFIHRDLNPSNVVLRGEQACIIDFGLVRIMNSDFHPTQTGQILGTPHYLAPEQIDPDVSSIGPHTDLFAAGVLVYHMLSGSTPTPAAASIPRVMRQILLEPPPPLGLPAPLEGALFKALEKSPAARYSSATEFAQALASAAPQKGTP
jgi:eukaryotic-like serine/threonine-protein kinase